MSVEHYDCDVCNETGIYEEYIINCNTCWKKICSSCTLKESVDFPFIGSDLRDDEDYLKSEFCPFCNGDKISNEQRISTLLSILKISREELDKRILDERKNCLNESNQR